MLQRVLRFGNRALRGAALAVEATELLVPGLLILTNGRLYEDAPGVSSYSVITYYSLTATRAQYD